MEIKTPLSLLCCCCHHRRRRCCRHYIVILLLSLLPRKHKTKKFYKNCRLKQQLFRLYSHTQLSRQSIITIYHVLTYWLNEIRSYNMKIHLIFKFFQYCIRFDQSSIVILKLWTFFSIHKS